MLTLRLAIVDTGVQTKETSQAWRAPLRDALGWLTAECHALYDRDGVAVLRDPAVALDGYGAVIGASAGAVRAYAAGVARTDIDAAGRVRAAELLELERGALRSLTSCAWFFDDLGGIETLQVLRYAAWAISLAGPEAARLEAGLTWRSCGSTSSPMSVMNVSSALMASSICTRCKIRTLGSIVVSHNCSGFISPRPL